jgi:hypothetical protein
LQDATAQHRGRLADSFDGTDDFVHQLLDVMGTSIGQGPLGQGPDPLVRIEFRGVRGKVFDMETGMLALEFCQQFSVVRSRIVEDRDHWTTQVPQEVAEEHANLFLPNVVEVKLVEKVQVLALRADGDSRDDRDFVPPITMPMHGSLAARGPGLDDIRDQQEPGFVGEDDMGTQPSSVFFTRGQSFFFHLSIAFSSRSTARFSGFW